uniref:Mitochondrial splicing suppressor protein 51 n=1 Tax=Tetraselmis sp. GSL018 TaxID=582737 RepID=A0A061SFL9_9CHLO|mmetsp:Transcript_10214/g.24362  ORF Transcript_10214/g.24362 Transcript_10214/m.24362 type:complete len:373 (-) Transcript_10214:868-1986(-)
MTQEAFSVNTCNHCGKEASLRCSACRQVSYCCQEHQQADWKRHKPACLYYRAKKANPGSLDEGIPKNEYVGTMRWSPDTKFLALPPFRKGMVPPLTGWSDFFSVRLEGAKEKDGRVVVEPPLLDGLSFPLTFLFALRELLRTGGADKAILSRKTILIGVLGASERAEQRLLRDTSYWDEVGHMFPGSRVELWLVGPEVSADSPMRPQGESSGMAAGCMRGTTGDFLKKMEGRSPILVGFNTGLGSGDGPLRSSWLGDLRMVLERNLLMVLTCANDHTDLRAEREVIEKDLGAHYALFPRRSPFNAVTTTHLPGRQDDTWACANSIVYAIQGYEAGKALPPGGGGEREPGGARRRPIVAGGHRPDSYDIEELD